VFATIFTGVLSLPAGAQNAASNAASQDQLQEVTVTGSRIIVNGNDAPTPVTVVTLDELAASKPSTVYEQLKDLPSFAGTGGATGIPTRGVNAGANTGANALDLRGLGAIRALVLFDGHRVPASTPDGQVDINLMPQMLMQRVDVVTGGASAVYGSDAVTGVMNFIIDRKFNGAKFDVQGGESSRHDDGSYSAAVAAGTDLFGGRGHIEASFQASGDQGLPNYLTRPSLFDWLLEGSGTAANPYHPVQGVKSTQYTYGGVVLFVPPPLGNTSFDQNGVTSKFVKGPSSASQGLNQNQTLVGQGGIPTVTALKARTKLDQFFARFDYDLNDDVHAWANVTAATDSSIAGSQPNLELFLGMSDCNAYLSAVQQAQLGCTNQNDGSPDNTFTFNKVTDAALGGSNLNSTVTTIFDRNYSFMGGLEGKFANDYHWNATYTYSESKQDVRNDGIDLDRKWFAALDAVVDPKSGNIVCNITLTNPGLQPGCVPIDEFGPSAETPAALAYSFGRVERWTTNRMNGLSGSITGAPVNDWAGPVGVAVSGEYRAQTMMLTSNTPFTPIDCTGIRFNCNSDPTQGALTYEFGNNIQGMTAPAKQNITEGAVEFDVPLVKDAPAMKSLSFNPAARYTSYDNKGSGVSTSFAADTWKLGLVWAVNDELNFRWTRSRDIRAPNMWELFAPLTQTTFAPGTTDYLLCGASSTNANCGDGSNLDPIQAAQAAPQVTSGNPHLKPEVGLTTTIGMVWKPTPDFSLAIDGYFINLKGAITTLPATSQLIQQTCYSGSSASLYCQTQARGANGLITKWFNNTVNMGGIQTSGIDFETNYRTMLAARAFSLRGLLTYKPHMIYRQDQLPTIDQAGAAYCVGCAGGTLLPSPVWRAQVFANYDVTQNFTVSLSERWRSAMNYQGDRTKVEIGGGVPAYYTTNLNLVYSIPNIAKQLAVYLNVQNVFDKLAPPVGSTGVGGGQPGDFGSYALGDDVVGRYYVVGVRGRL
jgi:outer membrane receptor protein involved in Fe transport